MYAARNIARLIPGGHVWLVVGLVLATGARTSAAGAGAAGEPLPIVRQALARALSVPGARVDSVVEENAVSRSPSCRIAEAETQRPLDGSGRIALKLGGQKSNGASCQAWTWVRVRVMAEVSVARRALRTGEPLAGAVVTEERELRAGHAPAQLGPQAVAARAIGAGQVVEADEISEPTIRAGENLKVLVVAGALMIEQTGRAVPCTRGRTCAVLPTGKRVEGDLIDGRLIVESQ